MAFNARSIATPRGGTWTARSVLDLMVPLPQRLVARR